MGWSSYTAGDELDSFSRRVRNGGGIEGDILRVLERNLEEDVGLIP